ncbi:TRAP transporter large permease [Hoeflea sp. CAU 1731]
MDRLDIGLISIVACMALMAIRVPIGVALISMSFIGIAWVINLNAAWGILSSIPYSFIATWELSAIPMFLLMGYVAAWSGMTKGLFTAMRLLFNWIPGNLAVASVGAAALFSAASGSSPATSAALARIAVPEMLKSKYDPALATGTIAAAGTLGSLIPPSIIMIIYGVFTNTEIGPLFVAGFLPGLLTAVCFSAMIIIRVKAKPALAPSSKLTLAPEERAAAYRDLWPLPTLIIGVLGGIMTGVFSPTEAGAVGALLAVLIAATRRSLSATVLWQSLRDAAISTAVIFFIAIGAAMFQRLMGISQIPAFFSGLILDFSDNKYIVILLISLIYLVLGCFLEPIGIMLLTLPIVLPLLIDLEIDLIWFGILSVKLLEIGLVTPPLGLNVYVVNTSLGGRVPLTTIFRGVTWFVVTDLFVLLMLVSFPQISLWLPGITAK